MKKPRRGKKPFSLRRPPAGGESLRIARLEALVRKLLKENLQSQKEIKELKQRIRVKSAVSRIVPSPVKRPPAVAPKPKPKISLAPKAKPKPARRLPFGVKSLLSVKETKQLKEKLKAGPARRVFEKPWKMTRVSAKDFPPPKGPSRAFLKREAEGRKRAKARLKVLPGDRHALYVFGSTAYDVRGKRGGYYAGRAAQVLRYLKANPRIAYRKWEIITRIGYVQIAGSNFYKITRDGIQLKGKYTFKQVSAAQSADRRRQRLKKLAERIGTSQKAVKEALRDIRRQQERKVARFKTTQKYAALTAKQKKRISVRLRMWAIIGAMCDLLEVFGS